MEDKDANAKRPEEYEALFYRVVRIGTEETRRYGKKRSCGMAAGLMLRTHPSPPRQNGAD